MIADQHPRVAILLSTFNGDKYLEEQLDSLLVQTYSNFVVVVRDDGSSDNTVEILNRYCSTHPAHFHLVSAQNDQQANRNLGASGGFSYLMKYALNNKQALGLQTAYLMFCDQDDVWFRDKIEQQMKCMLQVEAENSDSTPILVHSDLQVVAADKSLISRSMARYQGLETSRNKFVHIAISNLVTGCTALLNEHLATKALPVPENAIMHDWWLAMVATSFGKLEFMDQPLVYYRQHGSNTIGAKEHDVGTASRLRRIARALSLAPNKHLQEVAKQATAFTERYGQELTQDNKEGLDRAEKLSNSIGIFQRIAFRRARSH